MPLSAVAVEARPSFVGYQPGLDHTVKRSRRSAPHAEWFVRARQPVRRLAPGSPDVPKRYTSRQQFSMPVADMCG